VNQPPLNQRQARPRLHRSANNRMIAGVCGGLARTLGVDPLLVRVVALALLIPFHIFTVLVYVVLAVTLPIED
jgi:phage shock protein C